METLRPAGIRELPLVAGHLALDFANTVDDPLGPLRFDHIATYPALLAWAARVGLLSPDAATALAGEAAARPRAAARVARRAAELRAAMNDTFAALVDATDPGEPWSRLRPFVAAAIGQAELPGPRWAFTELESPLWPVAGAAYRLLTGSDLDRLKRCAGCPWLFLDQSKNGSRRWCSMDDCGRNEKMRRYVARRAARRRP